MKVDGRHFKNYTPLFNCVIETGTCSDAWKLACIIPSPKVNAPNEPNDLRLICVVLLVSKTLENHSGFRANHSCETELLSVIDDAVNATE